MFSCNFREKFCFLERKCKLPREACFDFVISFPPGRVSSKISLIDNGTVLILQFLWVIFWQAFYDVLKALRSLNRFFDLKLLEKEARSIFLRFHISSKFTISLSLRQSFPVSPKIPLFDVIHFAMEDFLFFLFGSLSPFFFHRLCII